MSASTPASESLAGAEPAPDLVVDSVTGVEVALPVAGPGARAYAFVVDWHIRAILALAWYAVGAMLYNRELGNISLPLETDGSWFAFVVLPAAGIYFLYHYVLEIGMRGRTPGKRIAGVRLVTRTGATPTLGAYLIRNVFRLVDNFPICYGLGLIMTMITRNHVRIGDLAAGTLLVYDRTDAVLLEHVRGPALGATLDAATAEIVNELLRRWDTLDVAARRRLAQSVLPALPVGEDRERATVDDATLRAQLERLAQGAPP